MKVSFCNLLVLLPLSRAEAQDPFADKRQKMVEMQIRSRDVRDARVLAAMERVPRHLFVPENLRPQAYEDYPLPIGFEKTISQPYICALMTDLLGPVPGDSVLEIGTGRG